MLQTSLHTLPSLPVTSARDLALTLDNLRSRMSRPLLLITSASAGAYAFIAYFLYANEPLSIPLASVSFAQGSFLPHAEATHVLIGAGWEIYAAAAAALGAIMPWQLLGAQRVEGRIQAAGEGIKVAEQRGLKTAVVDTENTKQDLEGWQMAVGVKGALAAVGALVGGYAAAWL